MEYSKRGRAVTEQFEGCSLVAYQDQVGIWTIGYGHTRGVRPGDCCTQLQADQWLIDDLADAVRDVNDHVTATLTQGEFDALVDFTFNLGDDAFNKSTLLKLVNHHDLEHAALEFEKWDHAGGKVVAGLLRRRLTEKQEFLQ
jgi:lysozyme